MAVSRKCDQCNAVKQCDMHETPFCGAPVPIAPKKVDQRPGRLHRGAHVCYQPFVDLSGGVQGCPVHGIRHGAIEYLCRPCARELGYLKTKEGVAS